MLITMGTKLSRRSKKIPGGGGGVDPNAYFNGNNSICETTHDYLVVPPFFCDFFFPLLLSSGDGWTIIGMLQIYNKIILLRSCLNMSYRECLELGR